MKYRNTETPLHVWRTNHPLYKYVSMSQDGVCLKHEANGATWDKTYDLIEIDPPERQSASEDGKKTEQHIDGEITNG